MRKAETLLKFRLPNPNHTITMAKALRSIPSLTEKNKENFHKKISTTPSETGCLEWTASKNPKGYGVFGINGRSYQAHRVACFLETGFDPGEFLVCHTCDNPSCCNFDHLWLGTNDDNMLDKMKKGRGNAPSGDRHGSRLHPELLARGESHGRSKLTEADIPIIRTDTRTLHVIAAEYGVAFTLIHKIKRRKLWKHVA